jgi:hypothetical protein
MKLFIIALLSTFMATGLGAQKIYETKTGVVKFASKASLEDIEAVNNQVSSKVATNGQMTFVAPIRGFVFENATMQEHFNENYMESSKYPKAIFMGTITNLSAVQFSKDGVYAAEVTGEMDMHGVKKKTSMKGTIEVKGGKLLLKCTFMISLADYKIGGTLIGEKIAKDIEVTVDCKYD